MSVELEIAGERVVIENWPDHFPDPPGPVDVNGERWAVSIVREAGSTAGPPPPIRPTPSEEPKPEVRGAPGATPVVPPMPGRVIELRVEEGSHVRRGDVLLVLEAMKMRNEIPSPIDGTVQGIRVRAGVNARAKEPMLFVTPD